MDTKKLDKWADMLLDTGKRSNLINFKDRKASTVEVLYPSTDILFAKVDGDTTLEVFDPMIEEEEGSKEGSKVKQSRDKTLEKAEESSKKAAFLAKYSGKLKGNKQILLYATGKNPMIAVKNIYKKARTFMEETGVNVAYMAFGFIHWKESDSSGDTYRAPILLVPIQIEQGSSVEPFFIHLAEDDIIVNPTFSYKMDAEHGVKLPEYEEEGLSAYLEKIRRIVSRLHWTVSSECKISTFSFLKINMYRDLKDNAEEILANDNVRKLLGESSSYSGRSHSGSNNYHKVADPLVDLHTVVDADSSQLDAIEMAKSGKSFILQGPPGTGKSQTITNIIAECLSDGKKVLFVSEKMAALNVVYDKLKQAKLAEFCLQLHSHKANKKEVIADICHTLRAGKSKVSQKVNEEIESKKKAQHQLDDYAMKLHVPQKVINRSLYQLYESYAAFRSTPDVEYAIPEVTYKSESQLREIAYYLEQYVEYIPSIGYDYRNNTWYGYINQDISYQAKTEVKNNLTVVSRFLQALDTIEQGIVARYQVQCSTIADAQYWDKFFDFLSLSTFVTPSLLNTTNYNMVNSILPKLQTQGAAILAVRNELKAVFNDEIYKLDGADYHKQLIERFDGFLTRLFNADYKQMMKELRLCKKDGQKPSYDDAVSLMEKLSDYQKKCAEFAETEAPVKALMGEAYKGVETDWNYIWKQMTMLCEMLTQNSAYGTLGQYSDFNTERRVFADFHKNLQTAFASCDEATLAKTDGYFDNQILNITIGPCHTSLGRLTNCLNELDKMDNWCHFRNLLSELNSRQIMPYIHTVIKQNLETKYIVSAFQKQFYFQWISSILAANPTLAAFNRISQTKAIETFKEKDTEQFEINKAKIRARLSGLRPSLGLIVPGSAVADLLRQGEKKRKQKSIRTLLQENGEFIQRIKPCFLMSPLSVSTFLAKDSVHFDVVIFDEASQIFPQDAIGAIYRAKQSIIVGDSKQMPPSNFFNSSLELDEEDEDVEDVVGFESILDLCSTTMQQLRLRWHYRSRYEQLIAFSNKHFYDNDLITFPSSKVDAPGIGVDYYYAGGIFDREKHYNRKEAEFIVDLIYQNIEKYPNRSLGVVAFSVAQQDLIDELLSKRRQMTPEKEYFFKNEGNEPFFIKNLETVQGDERDTIIFSIAYGYDAQGRLLHNFGPLNRSGGERRLNVAITRAKYNVQVVSSMHCTDIDLNRTSAEGSRLLREYLDYAEHGNIAMEREISVSEYEQFDSEFELEVCEYLRSKGFAVDTQVGCSGYRIDLGLKRPNSSDYVLAIECDGATYHSSKNARDRDRLRQEILERMGWKFYRIWSTDWFRNKSVEKESLLRAAKEAVNTPVEEDFKPEIYLSGTLKPTYGASINNESMSRQQAGNTFTYDQPKDNYPTLHEEYDGASAYQVMPKSPLTSSPAMNNQSQDDFTGRKEIEISSEEREIDGTRLSERMGEYTDRLDRESKHGPKISECSTGRKTYTITLGASKRNQTTVTESNDGKKTFKMTVGDSWRSKQKLTKPTRTVTFNHEKLNKYTYDELKHSKPVETFEEVAMETYLHFPKYAELDLTKRFRNWNHQKFGAILKEVLEVEAPLSEEWLLQRTSDQFGYKRVTKNVWQVYESAMRGCSRYGIVRKNGFLFLEGKEIKFRKKGFDKRDFKYISTDELAVGMNEILKQNLTVDKNNLYHALAKECGVSRVGDKVVEAMDKALNMLWINDLATVDGDIVSVK